MGGATAYLAGVLDGIKAISVQLGLGFGLSLAICFTRFSWLIFATIPFPFLNKELNNWKTHVKTCETLTTHIEDTSLCELDYEIDIVPLRNDRWLVSHPRHLLESWQANIDFQLIVDIKKVLRYMTKYVTKCESTMTKGIAAMMRNILRKTIADGLSV